MKGSRDIFMKRVALLVMMLAMLASVIVMSTIITVADTYFTIRINYVDKDGTPVKDPYIATYPAGESVELVVTNPVISGYDPVTEPNGGFDATRTAFSIDSLTENVTETVYYVAGMTHYSARYYKQNIYDDLYTLDRERTEANADLYGPTGSSPDTLEQVVIPGFTNLFREPDAIAADGSTVFRVYYDRNYYSVSFDLGDGGFGVDPVYAKFETVYRIKEPERIGYSFLGWARTNADSSKGDYGDDWWYIDENGDRIEDRDDAEAAENLLHFTESTVPDHDTHYKAIWEPATTSFSVVYWLENANDDNYSIIAVKDVDQVYDETLGALIPVVPDMTVNFDTKIPNNAKKAQAAEMTIESGSDAYIGLSDFFGFNLGYANAEDSRNTDSLKYEYDPENTSGGYASNRIVDFNELSKGESEELKGNGKYFELNNSVNTTNAAYVTQASKTIAGDGTTHFDVYYKRLPFTLKFYYAREGLNNNGTTNGKISLTCGTKKFSNYNYFEKDTPEDPIVAITMSSGQSTGVWKNDIATSLPQIKDEYLVVNGGTVTPGYTDYPLTGNNRFRYYYYSVSAKFNESLDGKWLIDAITTVDRKNNEGQCIPGSWAVEYGTNFYYRNTKKQNYTVKGFYEKLGSELMFRDREHDYRELHYLLSWTNTGASNSDSWNYGMDNVLHFTYENYVELLPMEVDMIVGNDVSALIDADKYENVIQKTYKDSTTKLNVTKWFGLKCEYVELSPYELTLKDVDANENGISDLIDNGVCRKLKYDESENKWYGLKTVNRIETVDSGNQYARSYTLDKRNSEVRSNQVAADITGFKLVNYYQDPTTKKVRLDTTNTDISWDGDAENNRHAQIKFYYNRLSYTLQYRNGNRLDDYSIRTVPYQAPITSKTSEGVYRYYYENPPYYIDSLQGYYEFIGWYEDPEFNGVKIEVDNPDHIYTMPADDDVFYAKWDPKMINVVFYNDYNDYYKEINPISQEDVKYGSYTDLNSIPINDQNQDVRPKLTPPAEKASFAGWYYIRNRVPIRFEPEKAPITGLNEEAAADNGKLRLYAEWVTTDSAKYKIRYVKKGTEEEIAPPTIGRAFIYKTKTFNAKSGNELYDEYKWTDQGAQNGTNWWPTTSSHSIVVSRPYQDEEFKPNVYDFEYVQKDRVHYKVQYLDASTGQPIDETLYPTKVATTTDASVKEDALIIPGWIAQETSKTMVLTASNDPSSDIQREQELAANVLTFYYTKNDTEYLYEAEYYVRDLEADTYTLSHNEILTVPIASGGADTTVPVASLYDRQIPLQLAERGFTRVANATKVTVTDSSGVTSDPQSVADDGTVTITGDTMTSIKVYFDRNVYQYSYRYIDYRAERRYLDASEEERVGMWNGVIEDHPNAGSGEVEKEIAIPAPTNLTYSGTTPATPYTRVEDKSVTLTIEPYADLNVVKVYYRKDAERRLEYKMICVNENNETDYDVNGEPLFGGFSRSAQTVEEYDQIQDITFYNYNDAMVSVGGVEENKHLHRYTFLGWYDNPEGTGTPLSTAADDGHPERFTLKKESLRLNGDLPAADTTYYALVRQDMITFDFYIKYTDEDLKNADDAAAAEIVQRATFDDDGSVSGRYVNITYPSFCENHVAIPWHRTGGINVQMDPIDNRVYRYEFAEWWQKDSDGTWIRKVGWNSPDPKWSSDSLTNVLVRQSDQEYYAVYTRKPVTTVPYTIEYKFKTRTHDWQSYYVTGTLDLENEADNYKYNVVQNTAFELTDEFIMECAPYESNHGMRLVWSDDPRYIDKNPKETSVTTPGTIVTTVTAYQEDQTVVANYRTAPTGGYTPISGKIGDNYELNEAMTAITAPETYNGRSFSHWEVRKSASDSAPVIAKSYAPLFDLCLFDDYWITPVYGGPGDNTVTLNVDAVATGEEDWYAWTWNNSGSGELVRPVKGLTFRTLGDKVLFFRIKKDVLPTINASNELSGFWNKTYDIDVVNGSTYQLTGWGGDNNSVMLGDWAESISATPTVTLTHLDYSRNCWTGIDGSINPNGSTDLLYTDFEIAFEDGTDRIQMNGDYQVGVVFELCDTSVPGDVFDPERDYQYLSDPTKLKSAILSAISKNKTSGRYRYDPNDASKTRQIQLSVISPNDLTNKDRVNFAKSYNNVYTVSGSGEITYTNSQYLMKATAYLIKDGKVTLSNAKYICLKDIASRRSIAPASECTPEVPTSPPTEETSG